MATYRVTAPDGNTYRVEGPDGATDEQVQAQILAKHPTAATKPQPTAPTPEGIAAGPPEPETSTFDKFVKGVKGAMDIAPMGPFGLSQKQMRAGGEGMMDKVYGARQFAANVFGTEDPEKLRQTIAQREEARKNYSLPEKAMHTFGNIAPDVLAMMYGGTGAAALLPKLAEAPAAIRAAASLAGAAGSGAALSPFQPTSEENYDAAERAKEGAAWGVGGNIGGRVLGRVVTPLKEVPRLVQEQVDYLKQRGAPMIAAMTTGNPMVEAFSHAFEKLPFSGIPAQRQAFKEWMTRGATKMAGTEMGTVGGGAAGDIMAKPAAEAAAIRALPNPIPLTDVPASVTKALNDTSVGSALAGRTAPRRILTGTRDVATNTPSITADEFMTAREELSRLAYNSEGVTKSAYKDAQQALEDSFKKANPNIDLDKWKTQYGRAKDIQAASAAGGPGGGTLEPKNLAAQLPEAQQVVPTDPFSKLAVTSAARFKPAPGGENRSALTAMLMGGAPMLGGAGLGALLSGDDRLGGAAAGAALTFPAARTLLGTQIGGKYLGNRALDAQRRAYLRRLIMGASIGQE